MQAPFVVMSTVGLLNVMLYLRGIGMWVVVTWLAEIKRLVLYTNIGQPLVNSLHGLLNCEIDGLDFHTITTEYITRDQCIHT